ncbi:hypothetical protein ACFVIM_21280 [Streptomyces sp. NPDC057638]|uniref:hypothetical protein n=1 Tax=Streptomyces sp. NPDC057638 TaxID=3346190 RepID=UPI0036BC22EB
MPSPPPTTITNAWPSTRQSGRLLQCLRVDDQPPLYMIPFELTMDGKPIGASLVLTPGRLRDLLKEIAEALPGDETEPALVALGLREPESVTLDPEDLSHLDEASGDGEVRADKPSRDPRP